MKRTLGLVRGFGRELYHRAVWTLRLRNIEKCRPIIVYQMGKVGSSTVVRTLKSLRLTCPILHVHTLTANGLRHAIRRQRQSRRPYLSEHLVVSGLLVKKLNRRLFPCRVITLSREPISRAISFLFEDHVKQLPGKQATITQDGANTALDIRLASENGIADPSLWFDQELKARFGIDIFAGSYDFHRGWSIFRNGGVEVLVTRIEDLDRSLIDGLRHFLHQPFQDGRVENANEGNVKWYACPLRALKSTYRVSPKLLEQILATRYSQHFYAQEIDDIRSRWSK